MAIFSVSTSQADINQRIIIYFNQPLTSAFTMQMHEQFKKQLSAGYSLAEHSSDTRWILILNTPLNQQQLEQFRSEGLKNNKIKHIELDQMLQQKTAPLIQ